MLNPGRTHQFTHRRHFINDWFGAQRQGPEFLQKLTRSDYDIQQACLDLNSVVRKSQRHLWDVTVISTAAASIRIPANVYIFSAADRSRSL